MLHPEDIQLAVLTVNRSPEYIHQTLCSLLLSGSEIRRLKNIDLVVGDARTAYLDEYKHHKLISIRSLHESAATQLAHWTVHRRFSFNYYRCLKQLSPDARGICICEDDIIVKDGFLNAILAVASRLEDVHRIHRYVLDLYIHEGLQPDPLYTPDVDCVRYRPQSLFGTQCIFYPRSVVPDVAHLLYRWSVADYRAPGDMVIRRFATRENCLYGPISSLVQHIGLKSTGLSETFYQAANFDM